MRLFWLLILIPGVVLADDSSSTSSFPMLFDIATNDLSISYLKILFGQVGSVLIGPPNTLVQEIFTIFNLGIMTLAGLLMCYTVVLSVVNTSQEGNPMGHKMSPWVVVRIVAGSSLMMPMTTGYAMIQVITMWMVIQGIGFADMIWSKAVDIISASPTSSYVPASASTNNAYKDISNSSILDDYNGADITIANLLASSLCLEASYQYDMLTKKDGDTVSRSDYYIKVGTSTTATDGDCDKLNNICFIRPDDILTQPVCGMHTPPASVESGSQEEYVAMSAAYGAAMALSSYVQNMYTDALSYLENGGSQDELARNLACLNNGDGFIPTNDSQYDQAYIESCAQTTILSGITAAYVGALGQYAYKEPDESSSSSDQTDWAAEAKAYGWLAAGAYYTSISASNSGTIDTTVQSNIDNMLYGLKTGVQFSAKLGNQTANNASNIYKIFDNYIYSDGVFKAKDSNSNDSLDFMNAYYMKYARDEIKYIADSMSVADPVEGASGETCQFDGSMTVSLDKSIKNLATYWLQWGGSQSLGADDCSTASTDGASSSWCGKNTDNVFRPMGLYTRSALGYAATEATVQYVADPQRGLFMLLNRAVPELMGVRYFDNFSANAPADFGSGYGDQGNYPNGGHADWSAVVNSDSDNFKIACQNGLIDPNAHGLYGQVLATMSGLSYEPLGQMRYMGLNIMRYGVDYFSNVIGNMIETYKNVGLAYWGLSIGFSLVMSSIAYMAIAAFVADPTPTTIPTAVAQMTQIATNTFNSGMNILYQVDQVTLSLWSAISATMAVTYTILGFIMGVYMANVPAIIFVFAGISFFMYVIEAMIASVLVALGLTHPEGHDLLGKAEQSVMLFLAAFIRPAAMIMGLIFSMLLMIPAFRLLNFTFIGFIGEFFDFFNDNGMGSIVPLIGAVGVAFLYVYLSMGIINNCLSLIYQIPDRLLRWLGAPTEPSMIQQMVNEIKGSVTDAAKSAGGGAESAAGSAKVSAQANIQSMGYQPEGNKKKEGEEEGGTPSTADTTVGTNIHKTTPDDE